MRQIEPCKGLSASALDAASAEAWIPVTKMPAMISDILVDQGLIREPWLPGGSAAAQWIEDIDWVYAVSFSVEDPDAQSRLIFKGLDTIVDVYFNGDNTNFT